MFELLTGLNLLWLALAGALTYPVRAISAEIHFQIIDFILTLLGI